MNTTSANEDNKFLWQCQKCNRTSKVVNLKESCPFCIPAKEWRSEFDEEFMYLARSIDFYKGEHYTNINKTGKEHLSEIKDFIQNLLTTQSAHLVAGIEKEISSSPFSIPIGEGTFKGLVCPECGKQRFVCRHCISNRVVNCKNV
jgi:hypothetical protein